MKKSIFLIFAAILCAVTANAQWALMGTLTDWSSGKAMSVSGTNATCTVDLPGKTTYTLKVKNGNTWYGRNSTTISATTTTNAFSTSGGDVTLNTDIPGTYTFSFNTSTKKLTVTYPTVPALHDITVRAKVPAHWTNDIYAHVWTSENASGSDVGPLTKEGDYYVVTKNAGALYVIFKNGSAWVDKNQTVDLCYTEDVCLQLNQSGTAKATATVIDCGAVSKDITVKAVVPGAWEDKITAWVWPTGGEGKEVTPTKEGNWYVITENCIELNVIFKNGEGWKGNEHQTANIEGVSENTCYQISALNKDGEGKCTYTVVDCEATIEPEEKPAPTPTFDYYVVGTINSWGLKDANFGMTDENADGVYEKEVTLAVGVNELKVNNGTWDNASTFGFGNLAEMYEETSDNGGNIKVTLEAEKTIIVKFDKNAKQITLDGLTVKTNVVTYDYYVIGTINGWASKDENFGMTDEDADGVYEKEVTLAAGDHEIKVNNGTWDDGCHWGFGDLAETYEETADASGNIKVTLDAEKAITVIFDSNTKKITLDGLTEKAPVVLGHDYYITGSFNENNPADEDHGMTLDGAVYKATVTLAAGDNTLKVTKGSWDPTWGYNELGAAYEEVSDAGEYNNIKITLAAEKEITVIFDATAGKITFEGLTEKAPVVLGHDYYITGSFNENNPADEAHGMTLDGTVYKATVTLAEGENTLKVTDGTWDKTWGANELGAAYDEVSNPNDYNNIKITLAAEKEITVIFDATAGKITFEGLTEKVVTPAELVTVYFINSGNWAEVACYYWGGTDAPAWPGVQMTANGEVFEAEGWNVYKITFPGDNTKCIFTDNKAEGATQTADLEVQNGKYYCYANGIWYDILADVDPLDTRVYLKGDMNEWCTIEGWCDMFRKEDVNDNVAYRVVYLEEANKTYEFKIEDAGTWLSNTGTMTKENCTGWTFEESVNDNAKITTEYVGEYTFVWDMTTKKLSVVYPELVPTVMDLVVTNMVFDGDNMTFIGTDNEYGIVFNLVVGDPVEDQEGVFALDASSTVDFGGTPFTNVTGTITPDMSMGMPTAATAVVYGFLGGSEYFQFNIDMSAGGGTLVEIWDGVATPNDGTGELTISATWEGDDVYVVVPGFNYTNGECPEVWFYVGGTTWETASIAAYGPATITVEDGGVLVEGSVMSGVTGTSYELMVFGLLPVVEEPEVTEITLTEGDNRTALATEGVVTVTVERVFEKEHLYTIALPFTINNAASVFGNGTVVYNFANLAYDKTNEEYILGFTKVSKIEAGKPYLIEPGQDVSSFVAENVTLSSATSISQKVKVNNVEKTATMTAVLSKTTTGGSYWLAEDKRLYNDEVDMPALRALFVLPTTPSGMPARARVALKEDAATGVEDLFTTDAPVKVIVNGQLIIIRDGEMYNVQGQLVK